MAKVQNFENHAKSFAPFHLVALPIFALNFLWSIYRVVRIHTIESVVALLLSVAFVMLAVSARIFAMKVQDRLIRLEMRLRLQQILPAELRTRIPEFEVGQLIALRFASDEELPALAQKVLDENLKDRKTIKRMVKNWQPDLLRA